MQLVDGLVFTSIYDQPVTAILQMQLLYQALGHLDHLI